MPPKGRTSKKSVNAIISVDDDFDTIKDPPVPVINKKTVVRRTKKVAAVPELTSISNTSLSPISSLNTPTSAITSRGTRNIPEWYFDLTAEYQRIYGEKVVVFLQVGQFFEIYGVRNPSGSGYLYSRIEEVASLCNLNIANKNSSFKDMPMVMAGFKPMYLDRYVPRLHEAGYTIPIYIETHEYADGSKHRELDSVLSPGTAFTNDSSVVSNNIACIVLHYVSSNKWIGEKQLLVGFSVVDVLSGDFFVDEFKNDYMTHDPCVFDDLERVCSIYQPSELLVIYNSSVKESTSEESHHSVITESRVGEILRFIGIHSGVSVRLIDMATEGVLPSKARNAEKQTYQKLAFERFFSVYDYASFETSTGFVEYPIAATAACFLLDYVHSHNSHLTDKIQEPIMNPSTSKLRLANHSLRQLHILEDEQGRNMGKARSVLTLLNNTDTSVGSRLFRRQLLNPIIDGVELKMRYDSIQSVLENFETIQTMRTHLRNIKDIERLYRRIVLEKITPDEMYALYHSLKNIHDIFQFLNSSGLEGFVGCIEKLVKFETALPVWQEMNSNLLDKIQSTLNLEECMGVNSTRPDTNIFIHGIYPDVDSIHKKSLDTVDIMNSIAKKLSDMVASVSASSSSSAAAEVEYCKIHIPERSPWYLEMTKPRSILLQKEIGKLGLGIIPIKYKSRFDNVEASFMLNIGTLTMTSTTAKSSSSIKIENNEIRDLCESIMSNESELRAIVGSRFSEFIKTLTPMHTVFSQLAQIVAVIDVALTNARNAFSNYYCRPNIVEKTGSSGTSGATLTITAIRHPIIERIQTDETYVANDIVLDGSQNTMLIFGTNAVGKTSLIRSVGVAVIMAQAGMYVPATAMDYVPFKHIFTRILGNDNLFRGLSTFAVEMSELRTILRDSTEDSLVLGDELCSGTELGSAISIFIASLEHLHNKNVKSMFATHFHEITRRHEISSLRSLKMKHMSVAYSPETGALIYYRKLQEGSGSDMYGLEVCKSMRLPEWFIHRAYDLREATPKMQVSTELESKDLSDTMIEESASQLCVEPTTLKSRLSQYSYKKALAMCEMCKKREATEVHHLIPQAMATSEGGVIAETTPIHKNHPANLMAICHQCHEKFTKENSNNKKHRRVKTTKGPIILEA